MPDEKELFSTLHIQLHTCNPVLRDLQGVRYSQYKKKKLSGEDAYLFLVQLNAFDKMLYNELLHPDARYDDVTDFSLSYQGISAYPNEGTGNFLQHIKVNASKGTLAFNGANTITDMINIRVFWFPNLLVKKSLYTKDLLQKLFHQKSFLNNMDAIRRSAQEELDTLEETFFKRFRKEENLYLLQHPQIRTINETKVKPYIYICDTRVFEKSAHLFSHGIVPDEKMKSYLAFPVQDVTTILQSLGTNEETASEVDPRYLKPRHVVPKSMVAFYAYIHPQKMQNEDVLLCVSSSILKAMKNLRDMTFCVITQEVGHPETKTDWRVSGVQILKALQKVFDMDYNRYRDAITSGINIPGENPLVKLVLFYQDKPVMKRFCTLGTGVYARNAMKNGFLDVILSVDSRHPEKTLLESEHMALNLYLRYTDFLVPYEGKEDHILEQTLSSVKESQTNWLRNATTLEPPIQEPANDDYYLSCYKAFRRYALIFPTNKAEDHIWKTAVQRMLDSGRTREQIQSFATWCLEQYDTAAGKDIQDALEKLE